MVKKKTEPKQPEVLGEVFIVKDIQLPSNHSVKKRPAITLHNKKPFIRRLLEDDISLAQIRELASNGSSITTIEAILKYPPNKLRIALDKGRNAMKDPKNPYKKFYLMFRSWVAEARSKAEATMAHRTPEKWMDRNSSNRLLESEEDRSLAIEAASPKSGPNVPVNTMLRALEILREQGVSIDESIDKGQLHISSNNQPADDDD